jgi:hypothetical protein
MPHYYVDPNADVGSASQWTKSSGTFAYAVLDDAVRSPTNARTGGDSKNISTILDAQTQELVFANQRTYRNDDTYTLYLYGSGGARLATDVKISVDNGSTWSATQSNVIPASASEGWETLNITGFINSQDDIAGLHIRLISNRTTTGTLGTTTIYAAYVDQNQQNLVYQGVVLSDNPNLYYTFQEDVGTPAILDASGNENNALLTGTLGVRGSTGQDDGALALNGSTQFVESPYTPFPNSASGSITLEVSVKTNNFGTSGNQCIIGSVGANPQLVIQPNGTVAFFYNGFSSVSWPGVWTEDNAWHTLMLTFNSASASTAKLYKDSLSQGTPTVAGSATTFGATGAFTIGARSSPLGNYLNGSVDEVSVYVGSLLSGGRAVAHFNAQRKSVWYYNGSNWTLRQKKHQVVGLWPTYIERSKTAPGITQIITSPWRGGPITIGPNGVNDLDLVDYEWYYNYTTGSSFTTDVPFVPMIYRYNSAVPINLNVSDPTDNYLLGFNEPDAPGAGPIPGKGLSTTQALDLWPNLMATGRQLGSPATTTGATKWRADFMRGIEQRGYRVDFMCVHWYADFSNPHNLVSYLTSVHKNFGRPVWLTEFDAYGGSLVQNHDFAAAVGPLLADLPWLKRVAWFTNRPIAGGAYANTGLVQAGGGALTTVGTAYKAWPASVAQVSDTPVGGGFGPHA